VFSGCGETYGKVLQYCVGKVSGKEFGEELKNGSDKHTYGDWGNGYCAMAFLL
jgi:hypothetical protein